MAAGEGVLSRASVSLVSGEAGEVLRFHFIPKPKGDLTGWLGLFEA